MFNAAEAFVSPHASISQPTYTSSQASTSRCSRRQAMKYGALSLISAALLPQSAQALDVFGVGDAIPADDLERVRSSVKGEVSFADFVESIGKGDVKQVWFFGTFKEYCCFQASDGVVRHVGEGYPVESSRSPESPLHVMAKVRDNTGFRKVPPALDRVARATTFGKLLRPADRCTGGIATGSSFLLEPGMRADAYFGPFGVQRRMYGINIYCDEAIKL